MRLGSPSTSPVAPSSGIWSAVSRVLWVWLSLALGVGLPACAPKAPPLPANQAEAAPGWTYRKPDDPSRIYGLGRAPLSGGRDARETALTLARNDALATARQSIQRWAYATAGEALTPQVEAYWERVAWDRQERLIEELGTLEWFEEPNRGRVWVLVTVERSGLVQGLDAWREKARSQATNAVSKADAARARGDLVGEITGYAAALGAVAGPEGLTLPGASPNVLLRTELEGQLQRALAQVDLVPVESPPSLRPGKADGRVSARALKRGTDQPVPLPLLFDVYTGEGEVGDASGPDGRGVSHATLTWVGPRQAALEVTARPDLAALLGRDRVEGQMVARITGDWDLPHADFPITVTPLKLLLTYLERGGTGGQRGPALVEELGDALRDVGFDLVAPGVDDLRRQDVYLAISRREAKLTAADLPGVDLVAVALVSLDNYESSGRAPESFTASGEGTFVIYDPQSRVYSVEVTTGPLRFAGFSQGDAERGFFLQASDRLRDRVIDQLANQDVLR